MPNPIDFLPIDLSIDASIIAQQLTLIAADLYHELTLAECELWQSLSPNNPTTKQTPHINAIIHHSNELRAWVLHTLNSSTNQQQQTAQVASHIIAIADACLALNNFSTLFSIVSALSEEPAQRPLMSISVETRMRLTQMQEVVSAKRGFWHYRQVIRTAQLPCVPVLAFALTDLSYVEDGTPKSKPEVKRQKTAKIWRDVERFQSERYQFDEDSGVQEAIRSWMELSDLKDIKDFI